MEYEIKTIYKKDKEFPNSLRRFKNCPKQLYVIGNVALLKSNIIAIVGSRDCTEYGWDTARKFSRELANSGVTVISGMAVGVDTAAHLGTLECNGNTIAVLGGGFNHIFPLENIELFNNIINRNGLIITEYPPDEETKSSHFPKRNRIISGVSIRSTSCRSWV